MISCVVNYIDNQVQVLADPHNASRIMWRCFNNDVEYDSTWIDPGMHNLIIEADSVFELCNTISKP